MTGRVALDREGSHLVIQFPYREDLVAMVRALPARRWDAANKAWRVPAGHVEAVYAACSRHLFEFAPEVTSLLAGTLGGQPPAPTRTPPERSPREPSLFDAPPSGTQPAGPGPAPAPEGASAAPALTVGQLNRRVQQALRGEFPDLLWVVGEVVGYDKAAARQHRFFQLAERQEGQARPAAAVDVALFSRTAEHLLPALAAGEPPLTLRDGIEIRALVRVDFHAQNGRFQLIVEDIDKSFTLGKLLLTREAILRDLVQKGLAEQNRARGFPVPALRIGVLTSPDADGWNDFRRHLEENGRGLEITLFPVKVQGHELERTMLRGLKWFRDRAADFDVLCIVRGGGSRTDLSWFDNPAVALAVATHPLKIVVGIGHQRDQSVLDFIAHSEKTPTAVADLLVRGVDSAREAVQERSRLLQDLVVDRIEVLRTGLRRFADRTARAARLRIEHARRTLAGDTAALGRSATRRIERERAAAQLLVNGIRAACARRFERLRSRLDAAAARQRLLDPRTVLARGYALIRREDRRIATSLARIEAGSTVEIQFHDGRAAAHVTGTTRDDTGEGRASGTENP
jgi:exodeoxyribonuclease VII large subunit